MSKVAAKPVRLASHHVRVIVAHALFTHARAPGEFFFGRRWETTACVYGPITRMRITHVPDRLNIIL